MQNQNAIKLFCMPNKQNVDLLYALRDFVRAIDPKNNEPAMLAHSELSAGQALLSAIDKMVDARVQAILKAQVTRGPLR